MAEHDREFVPEVLAAFNEWHREGPRRTVGRCLACGLAFETEQAMSDHYARARAGSGCPTELTPSSKIFRARS